MQIEVNDIIIPKMDLAPLKSFRGESEKRGKMKKGMAYEVGGFVGGLTGMEVQVVRNGKVVGFIPLRMFCDSLTFTVSKPRKR